MRFCKVRPKYSFNSLSDLDEESIRNFLRANPSFLEDYVMKHVDQDRLERWLIRKTRKLKNKGSKKATNSLDHDNNKQSGKKSNILSTVNEVSISCLALLEF